MEHILACDCGDCAHWEIGSPEVRVKGFLGTAWAHPQSYIHCVTCGHKFPVTISVDPHAKLKVIDRAEKSNK